MLLSFFLGAIEGLELRLREMGTDLEKSPTTEDDGV